MKRIGAGQILPGNHLLFVSDWDTGFYAVTKVERDADDHVTIKGTKIQLEEAAEVTLLRDHPPDAPVWVEEHVIVEAGVRPYPE